MKPSTEQWLLSTISKRLQRIAEGKELMAEDRALTLLGILKDVAGDVPSLDSLPLSTKEWLEAAINSRLVAMEEGRELAEEARIATLTEALAALRPAAAPGGAVERVETGAGLSGGPIVSTGTISLSTATQAAVARANTAVQPEDLADVATSGNYADLTNTPTIPEQFNPIQGANILLTGTYPNITFSAVAGEEFTPVWGEVQGNLEDQTDLQEALNGKAPAVHTHTAADITSGTLANARISQSSVTQHQAALSVGWGQLTGLPAYATRWPSWGEVTGKPATFAPSAHTHSIANITGLQVALDDKMDRSIPALDPVGEVGDNGSNYGMVLQPFRIGKNSSVDAPSFFGTNLAPYLWLGSSGASSQQGALLGVYASSTNGARELAFRGRSGSGWSDWARVWHDGNLNPSDYAPTTRSISAGNGLSGGGSLASNRTISLGTPGTLTGSTTNSVTTSSHTHALSTNLSSWDEHSPNNALIGKGVIPGSQNLNDYTTTGIYHQNSNADASSGSNYPSRIAGMLTVYNSGSMTYQTYQAYNSGNIWSRTRYNTNWSAWRLAADESITVSAGNGLTGGGNLTTDRTIALGTPGAITATSTNTVSAGSHTHNLDTTGNFTWTGNHKFTSSSNTGSLTVERTGGTPRNAYVTYSTNATTIYAGIANVNDTTWGIGTSTNLTSSNTQFQFDTSTGNMTVSGTVTAANLTATSDPRLKANKQKTKARRELIEKLEYWSFEWKKDGTKGRSVMADKVQEIAPEHVHVADDEMGTLSVDKGALALEMVFALIDRLKEMDEETVHVVD